MQYFVNELIIDILCGKLPNRHSLIEFTFIIVVWLKKYFLLSCSQKSTLNDGSEQSKLLRAPCIGMHVIIILDLQILLSQQQNFGPHIFACFIRMVIN